MRGPSTILVSRSASAGLEDLAPRSGLIAGQRVRHFRLRRRLRRRARSVMVTVGLAALAVGAVAGASAVGHWALTSPRFGAHRIDVEGERRLTREQIVEASGIEAGENLWRLDTRAMVERLEALAGVKAAAVVRRPPDRVVMTVQEREPFALVQAGRLHWVDGEGIDLGPVPRAVAPEQPVLSGVDVEALGARGRAATPEVARGLALLRFLRDGRSPLRARVSEIDVGRPEGPVLVLLDGVEVRLGPTDWEVRLGRLLGVLAQLETSGEAVTAIDLRFRDQVVLKTGDTATGRAGAGPDGRAAGPSSKAGERTPGG